MKTATAKDLRYKTSQLLDDVRRGQAVTITYRGKSIAVLAPVDRGAPRTLELTGFGLWKGRKDIRDVEKWLRKLREPRFTR